MKVDAIFKKWAGKKVDSDGAYGCQCVDWVKQFVKEAYAISLGGFGGSALSGWTQKGLFDAKWKKYEMKNGFFPLVGDILFFGGSPQNPYGHTAIASYKSSEKNLCLIEQNAGSGNGDGLEANGIQTRILDYSKLGSRGPLLGWYRYNYGAAIAAQKNIWNGQNPEVVATRKEAALFLSRASKKDIQTLWNGQNPDNPISSAEISLMSQRACGTKCFHSLRQDIALFCFLHG